jgi:hypothetical protein
MIPEDPIPLNSKSALPPPEETDALFSLIFLGSKEYPYKGVLDQLANRAGSNGTNAWTANDRELAVPTGDIVLKTSRHGIYYLYCRERGFLEDAAE